MLQQLPEKDDLPEQTRRELFHTLVQAQDQRPWRTRGGWWPAVSG
jgi:hypothetical protein